MGLLHDFEAGIFAGADNQPRGIGAAANNQGFCLVAWGKNAFFSDDGQLRVVRAVKFIFLSHFLVFGAGYED